VLVAGWELDLGRVSAGATFSIEDVRRLHFMLGDVDLAAVRPAYVELVHRLRYAGIPVSDRRAVKIQRLMAASALLCGRLHITTPDLWVLRYIWDTEEQQEIIASIVQAAIDKSTADERAEGHPRALGGEGPDPESLARDLEQIAGRLGQGDVAETDRTYLKDRLGLLAARCQWVADAQKRTFLEQQADALWQRLG
jgi:MoxR-like ATPase